MVNFMKNCYSIVKSIIKILLQLNMLIHLFGCIFNIIKKKIIINIIKIHKNDIH